MSPPPPPPFPSPLAGPPPFRGFASAAGPPPGPFRGPPPAPPPPPPPPQFPPSPFPTFSGGGLPSPAYPPPPRPLLPPHLSPWQQPPPPPLLLSAPPPRPSSQWRPEASPLLGGERPRLGPEGPALPGGLRREDPAGGEGDEGGGGEEGGLPPGDPWLSRFLARHRARAAAGAPGPATGFGPGRAAGVAAEVLRLVARLSALCAAWRERGDAASAEEVAESEALRAELREAAAGPLRSEASWRRGLERNRQKRLRRRQRRQEARVAREEAAARVAEREAQIERWRARRAQEVEDRRREQELKAAADSVLSEVRKKQADTKRITEILRGLEKLRKLRKEAAGRKGVCPPPAADEAFENEVQAFKTLIKKRTELYEAEERALRVMLEGEQEEERKRDLEKKEKKEKEKLLQQKREIDSKLFGDADEFPLTHILEPFTQYYLQAEYSVSSLIQIRHEWDRYLVPADHPEGHFIPPGWVLPSPPSNDVWATAVK
uniref:Programmed cell death protein 7 n=1 Tax=Pogona vitticeps TaxID=103695 RepID=A0ABM5EX29_9SAUR